MEYTQEQLLDKNIIDQLKDLGDDFFNEIISLYNDQYPELYSKIIEYNQSQDLENLSKAAHTLKGASLNIGAKELAAICKSIELDAKSHTPDNLNHYIDQLTDLYKITMAEYGKL